MLCKFLIHFALIASTLAFPSLSTQYQKPPSGHAPANAPWAQKGIARSPCPALNALANHNFLPHTGRNMTGPQISTAIQKYLNFDGSIVTVFGFLAAWAAQCQLLTNATTPCTHYDLDMLNIPHAAEHDGSLSRQDYNYGTGNNYAFNAGVWSEVTNLWTRYNRTSVSVQMAQTARAMRFTCANETDKAGWFKAVTQQSLGETAFYMSVFSDPKVPGTARKDWVHYFFSTERLPYDLGWNATQRSFIQAPALLSLMSSLAQAPLLEY